MLAKRNKEQPNKKLRHNAFELKDDKPPVVAQVMNGLNVATYRSGDSAVGGA